MTPNSKHWGFVESAVCTSVIAEKLFTRRLGRVQNDDRLPPEKTPRHQYHFGIVLRRKSNFGDEECSFASVGLLSIGSSGFIWAIDDRVGFRIHRLKAFGEPPSSIKLIFQLSSVISRWDSDQLFIHFRKKPIHSIMEGVAFAISVVSTCPIDW